MTLESIITNERYTYITSIIGRCYTKKRAEKMSVSDKIDHIVTNRFLALPIFAAVMWVVYYVSVTTVGTWATDWANDGVFGKAGVCLAWKCRAYLLLWRDSSPRWAVLTGSPA